MLDLTARPHVPALGTALAGARPPTAPSVVDVPAVDVTTTRGLGNPTAAKKFKGYGTPPSTRPAEFKLCEGLVVETIDGHKIGEVAGLGEDCFLTRRRHHEDFWLPEVFVRSVDDTKLVLHVDTHGLRRYTPRQRSVTRPFAALGFVTVAALITLLGFGF